MAGSRLPCRALPGSTRRTASSSGTRQSTPTTSAPASPISPEQLAGADAEMHPRHAGPGQRVEDPLAVRQHGPAVVLRADRARPGVEQLHGRGPGRDLDLQEGDRDVGQPAQQRIPQRRVPVHQRLGLVEALGRSPVDQVRGQRERAAGEADQRRPAELGDQRLDRVRHVLDIARLKRANPLQVGLFPDRLLHHRARPRRGCRCRRPTARSGTTMSLNRIAASTGYRRSGCSVISVIRSGLVHASTMALARRGPPGTRAGTGPPGA